MRKFIALLFLLLSVYSGAQAQDIITLLSGEELNAKIISLNPSNVVYISRGTRDTLAMHRDEVLKLRYQNGTMVYITDEKKIREKYQSINDSAYLKGIADASKYYTGYKGATTGTIVSAIVFPFNLIPAIACSATPPSMKNLGYPDPKFIQDPGYYQGYSNQAYKIKKKKVWGGYAIGSGAIIAFYILLSVAAASTY